MTEEPGIPDHWVRRLVAVTVVAAAVYAAFAALGDVQSLRVELDDFALWTLPAALGLVLVGYLLRAQRWQLYLHTLDVRTPFRDGALVFLSGFAMGITPGKMGEVVKAYYLRESHGTPYAKSIPAVFAERVNDMVAVAALLGIGLLFVPHPVAYLLGALGVGFVLAGLLVLRSQRLAAALLRFMARAPRLRKTSESLGRMHANLTPLLGGKILLNSTALGLAGWALEALAMTLLAHGFGLDLTWGECAFVFSAGSIAGVLSFLPGGLGVTEGGMVALLALLGVAVAPATALTLAIRLSTLWFGVLMGLLAIVALRALRRRRQASSPEAPAPRR